MENEVTSVDLGKKIANITLTNWDYDFDPDEILKIDYFNIVGELITISVLVNRIGNLVAEMRGYTKEQKIRLEIKEAEVKKLFRGKRSVDGAKSPTISEVDDHITLDPLISNLRLKLIRNEEDLEKLESLYNAVKDKSYKLNGIGKNLIPKEHEDEILEGSINGVLIKLKNKHYPIGK